ncbi:protein kintoun [Rhinophrynus dorsalis]
MAAERLELSAEELERFTRAFQDAQFREMFAQYAEEISDPENRRRYEEEILQMEKDRGVDIQFLHPQPGHVLLTSINGVQRCYLNICTSDLLQKPQCKPGLSRDNRPGQHWALPYSLAPGREEMGRGGTKYVIYDVLFHPDTLQMASKSDQFKQMVDSTALEAVARQFCLNLDTKNVKTLSLKYKGVPQATVLRKPCTDTNNLKVQDPEYPLHFPYPCDIPAGGRNILCHQSKDNKEATESCAGVENTQDEKATIPHYTVIHRSYVDLQDYRHCRDSTPSPVPKELVITVDLPLLNSTVGTSLHITGNNLILESEKPLYKLNLKLPYPVNDHEGKAQFNKAKRQLIITAPVIQQDVSDLMQYQLSTDRADETQHWDSEPSNKVDEHSGTEEGDCVIDTVCGNCDSSPNKTEPPNIQFFKESQSEESRYGHDLATESPSPEEPARELDVDSVQKEQCRDLPETQNMICTETSKRTAAVTQLHKSPASNETTVGNGWESYDKGERPESISHATKCTWEEQRKDPQLAFSTHKSLKDNISSLIQGVSGYYIVAVETCAISFLQYKGGALNREILQFQVIMLPHYLVVLGYPWLKKHNPSFKWRKTWSLQCADTCFHRPVKLLCTSLLLSLPKEHQEYSDMFSKSKAMEQYVADALSQGFIRKSTSSAGAGLFFVKNGEAAVDPPISRLAQSTTLPLVDAAGLKDVADKKLDSILRANFVATGAALIPIFASAWVHPKLCKLSVQMLPRRNYLLCGPIFKKLPVYFPFQGKSLFGPELKQIISNAVGGRRTLLPQIPTKRPIMARKLHLFHPCQMEAQRPQSSQASSSCPTRQAVAAQVMGALMAFFHTQSIYTTPYLEDILINARSEELLAPACCLLVHHGWILNMSRFSPVAA